LLKFNYNKVEFNKISVGNNSRTTNSREGQGRGIRWEQERSVERKERVGGKGLEG